MEPRAIATKNMNKEGFDSSEKAYSTLHFENRQIILEE